jgi:hypothetical protein
MFESEYLLEQMMAVERANMESEQFPQIPTADLKRELLLYLFLGVFGVMVTLISASLTVVVK